jgi:hypothetical protein
MSGVWSARFCDGTGKITVDDTLEATGHLTVSIDTAPDTDATGWELLQGDTVYVQGKVITHGC